MDATKIISILSVFRGLKNNSRVHETLEESLFNTNKAKSFGKLESKAEDINGSFFELLVQCTKRNITS